MKKVARCLTSMLFIAVLAGGFEAAAARRPIVMPLNSHPYGQSYGEWSAAWWQWAFSLPIDQNPWFDETGCANGANGQSGHVWFLTGVMNSSGVAVRECFVPAGKALFFPVLNAECSTIEPPPWYGGNEQELRACAKANMDPTAGLACEVDGVPIPNVESYRVQSPLFEFCVPENNVLGVPAGTCGYSISDGVFLMLAPLPPGKHTVHFTGTFLNADPAFNWVLDITYLLTVGNPDSPILPPESKPYGKSYADWNAAWWQWLFSIPAADCPLFDETGAKTAVGQSGNVWFLVGNWTANPKPVRYATIPAGKALFFPISNNECSSLEGSPWFGNDPETLASCLDANPITPPMWASLDGVPVSNLENYYARSSMYTFSVPDGNILGVAPSSGVGMAQGVSLMLAPLSKGEHIVQFGASAPDTPPSWYFEVTYILTVK